MSSPEHFVFCLLNLTAANYAAGSFSPRSFRRTLAVVKQMVPKRSPIGESRVGRQGPECASAKPPRRRITARAQEAIIAHGLPLKPM